MVLFTQHSGELCGDMAVKVAKRQKSEEDMKIKLNDKYQITGVPLNFVLEEKKVHSEGKEKGVEYFDTIGYYPSLETLLRGLATHSIQQSNCEDVKLLIQEIKTLTRSVTDEIKALGNVPESFWRENEING